MSVLIKGMEMPKDCWHCRLADPIEGGSLVDQKMHGDWDEPDNCPLIPVPDHGRLIDADALEKSMIEREERLGDEQAIWESSAVSVALDNFAKTIIEADREVDND